MPKNDRNPISPRLRVYGEVAEFETERHLEWFFWDTVLAQIGLQPLKTQYTCREGRCDILAKGSENQLVIIELKNTQDPHVIDQITAYFDALKEEQPFAEQVDYSKPIELYTVCPTYTDRIESIIKYHQLDFTLLSYTVKSYEKGFIFQLYQWLTGTEVARREIPAETASLTTYNIPSPPKLFVDLLGKCSEDEKQWVLKIRDQIYQFSEKLNYKIYEQVDGKWIRFERNKQNSIAEVGWDSKRDTLAIYIWLPFTTVSGRLHIGRECRDTFKRTAMMRLWVVDEIVKYVGFIKNGRKSWLVVTSEELQNGTFTKPTKLQKSMDTNKYYWNGLAMPTQLYLKMMGISENSESLKTFVELALEHSIQRIQKNRKKDNLGTLSSQETEIPDD